MDHRTGRSNGPSQLASDAAAAAAGNLKGTCAEGSSVLGCSGKVWTG